MAALPIALTLLGQAPQIIGFIGGIVHGIEGLFGHGNGAQKKQAAQQAVSAGLQTYRLIQQDVPSLPALDVDALNSAISATIDSVVQLYNLLGVFSHAPATAPGK